MAELSVQLRFEISQSFSEAVLARVNAGAAQFKRRLVARAPGLVHFTAPCNRMPAEHEECQTTQRNRPNLFRSFLVVSQ